MSPLAPPRVACLGAAHWDHKLVTQGTLRPSSSNPVNAWPATPGGVARNVAENLVALGAQVALASVVGDDPAGRALRDEAQRVGIDTRCMLLDTRHPTGSYTAILNPQGELEWAFSAMAGIQEPPPEYLSLALSALSTQSMGVADLNLPQAWLQALVDHAAKRKLPLALVAVSEAKMAHLPVRLHGVTLLVLNQAELNMVGDFSTLRARGLKHLLVTLGAQGAAYSEGDGLCALPASPLPPSAITDVTGAGDAFSAAAVWTLMGQQRPLREACLAGLDAAAHALTTRLSALSIPSCPVVATP